MNKEVRATKDQHGFWKRFWWRVDCHLSANDAGAEYPAWQILYDSALEAWQKKGGTRPNG